ncbi:MAG: tRNA glutamyl-Q(34) synthetase GluQRS [Deltaproteobacteria bacterium]|jgi:glutamyl-Q tRNA(Asp) synthetase|nr:tRNA glutamyl-Q(34) synthetase GluQRS [Deltaproteobacteria bacterium]MBW2477676.1 tRNA glutamyl-Q(34) synthetase GluQRS [Deltaproteobacteria bacterium]MBW2505146.1 tRNA glutamyl-Q(34) synthetase GluQRS [Deltaproteobacteria bacterium]MBW2520052.1 tRNA glutamyl-Q(34) synthetase GluQRS [Deltaproteobacteria bacterium]
MSAPVVGRFAPSPTGPLHFGSLIAAVGSYCLARKHKGLWLLRMEDLDTPRVVPGAADDILRTLDAFGLHWDGEIVWQSQRIDAYQSALEKLQEGGRLFACGCSRKEVIASAPHPGEEGPVYAGTCRRGLRPGRKPRSLRLHVPEERICFTDGVYGAVQQVLSRSVGDFVLRRADGLFAYQLAVVVDDSASGVTQVVRGADLLSSTPRQIYLHACLGTASPTYYHLPLAVDSQGEKISKRHGPISVGHESLDCGLLQEVLRFLGQSVPKELALAPAREVLRWAECCFDQQRIPANLDGLYVKVEKFV